MVIDYVCWMYKEVKELNFFIGIVFFSCVIGDVYLNVNMQEFVIEFYKEVLELFDKILGSEIFE